MPRDLRNGITRRPTVVVAGDSAQDVFPRLQRRKKIVATAIGARTSAYTGQVGKHNSFYLAVPARANRGAELWVYETRD